MKQEKTGDGRNAGGRNMLGAYGGFASGLSGNAPGPLSFRDPGWKDLGSWKKTAREKTGELLARPETGTPQQVNRLRTHEYDGVEVQEITWSLPYGPPTAAVMLKPAGSTRRLPGILALHDHGGVKYFGKRKIIRTGSDVHPFIRRHQETYYGARAWANEAAKRGYAVLVPDVFPFGSRRILPADVPDKALMRMMSHPLSGTLRDARRLPDVKWPADEDIDKLPAWLSVSENETEQEIAAYNAFAAQHEHIIAKSLFSAGTTWPGVFLAEDQAALDYLASRADVDPSRLGCGGLSGGGLRTNYLAAMDDRIRCSVTAGFMTTWNDLILNVSHAHTWMTYVPLLPRYMDYPEILGLRVPLPTLVLQTNQDELFTLSEAAKAEAILGEVYRKAGAAEHFRMSFYDGPHKFDVPMQEDAFDWFDRWLK